MASGVTRLRSVTDPRPNSPILKKGILEKRQRGRSHRESSKKRILKFQKRFVELSYTSLQYYENEKAKYPKGNFPLSNIQIVEAVRDGEFGGNCKYFQVGNYQEIMYFGATNSKQQGEWMDAIRDAALELGNHMLDKYHPSVYYKGKWGCCNIVEKEAIGCSAVCHSTQTSSSFKFSPRASPRRPELTLSLSVPGQYYDNGIPLHRFDNDFLLPASAPTSPQYSLCRSKSFTTHQKLEHFLKTGSQISRDSGLGSEFWKLYSRTSLMTQEDTSLSEMKKHDQIVKKESHELQQLLSVPDDSDSDDDTDSLNGTKTMEENYSTKLDLFTGNAIFKEICFRSVHELVAATSHEVHVLTTTSLSEAASSIYKSEEEIESLTTWRSLVAVKETNKITILDLDKANSRLTISTDSVSHADFTPDGSTFIVAGNVTSTSYSRESQNLQNIIIQALPQLEIMPQESQLMYLLIHPDPRQPYAVLMVADKLSNILFIFVYNYYSKRPHCQRIGIGAIESALIPHAAFSNYNLKLYILYGSILSVLNVEDGSMQQEDLEIVQDMQVSCIKFTSLGKHLAVALKNGDILMLDVQHDHINYLHKIENPTYINKVAFSLNDMILAMVSDTGELSLFKNPPSQHPSVDKTMKTIEIPRCGKENVMLGDDISVDFPEDFIEEDSLEFEYAITAGELFGPFSLPEEKQLISAILSLHPKKDGDFKRPIRITMPHVLHFERDDLNIAFCKAEVTDVMDVNNQNVVVFKVPEDHKVHQSSKLQKIDGAELRVSYASLETYHTCHLCMITKFPCNTYITKDNNLFFIQVKPRNIGKSREFTIEYIVTQFLTPCLQTIEDQYPEKDYEKKKLVFSFLPDSEDISMKISNTHQLESDGWKATVEGRKKISRKDLNFTDIPPATLKCMCDEKEYPPHFSIRISSLTDDAMPKKSKLSITLDGALERVCDGQVHYEVELQSTDISPPEQSTVGGDDSYQARTVQSCLVQIADEINDPKVFCIHLFSAMILTRSQYNTLQSSFQQTNDKIMQNYDVLLVVHLNVSNNVTLFEPFCKVLKNLNYLASYELLQENFRKFKSGSHGFEDCYSHSQQQPVYSSTV